MAGSRRSVMLAVVALLFAVLLALDLEEGLEVLDLAVVAGEGGSRVMRAGAEVGGVFEQALLAALHFQGEFGDGGVGDGFEGVSDSSVDAFDMAVEGDVDLFVVQGRYEIR